jgi:hypothetical protein
MGPDAKNLPHILQVVETKRGAIRRGEIYSELFVGTGAMFTLESSPLTT